MKSFSTVAETTENIFIEYGESHSSGTKVLWNFCTEVLKNPLQHWYNDTTNLGIWLPHKWFWKSWKPEVDSVFKYGGNLDRNTHKLHYSGRMERKRNMSLSVGGITGERRTLITGDAPITSFLEFIRPPLPFKLPLILIFYASHLILNNVFSSQDEILDAHDLWPLGFHDNSHTHVNTRCDWRG